jgi:hypothetical protein
MSFFAVQVKPGESDLHVIERILRTAHGLKLSFLRIDVLDKMEVGVNKYLRLKSDLSDLTKVLDLLAPERGVVGANRGVYVIRVKGRTGKVPNSTMLMTPRTPKAYRGTADPHWERQFMKV